MGFLKKAGEYLLDAFSMGGYSAAKHLKDVPAAAQKVLGEINGSAAQARENAKQREWQTNENDRTAQYNLELAQMQNRWNIEQWQRENEYNSPSAQMARYGAAGLNPNLIYGQSNTAPQLSGSLTSGSSKSPAQGQFDTQLGQRSNLLNLAMQSAQVANLRAQTKKIEADTKSTIMDNSFTEFLRSYNPDGDILSPEWTKYVNSISGKKALHDLDNLWYQVQKNSADYSYLSEEANVRRINALIQGDLYHQIQEFAKDMDVSRSDAEVFIRSMLYAARGIKADALLKEGEAIWNDPSFLEKLPAGLPKLAMFLRSLLK